MPCLNMLEKLLRKQVSVLWVVALWFTDFRIEK